MRRARRNNYRKLFCRDLDVFTLKIYDNAQTESKNDNAVLFKQGVSCKALKSANFKTMAAAFKYCKINRFWWKISAFAVDYDVVSQSSTGKQYLSLGVNFFQKFPMRILWDLDQNCIETMLPEKFSDSIHAKKFYVGGKPVKFSYSIPKNLNRYMTSESVEKLTWDNQLGDVLSGALGISNFRAPQWFHGGIGDILQNMGGVATNHVFPLKIFLCIESFASVTFMATN